MELTSYVLLSSFLKGRFQFLPFLKLCHRGADSTSWSFWGQQIVLSLLTIATGEAVAAINVGIALAVT